jgi:hypothetical protein
MPPLRFGGVDPFESKTFQAVLLLGMGVAAPVVLPAQMLRNAKIKAALSKDYATLETEADKVKYFKLMLDKAPHERVIRKWVLARLDDLKTDQAKFDAILLLAGTRDLGEEVALIKTTMSIGDNSLIDLLLPPREAKAKVEWKRLMDGYAQQTTDRARWHYLRDEVCSKDSYAVQKKLTELIEDEDISPTIRLGVALTALKKMHVGERTRFMQTLPGKFPKDSPERDVCRQLKRDLMHDDARKRIGQLLMSEKDVTAAETQMRDLWTDSVDRELLGTVLRDMAKLKTQFKQKRLSPEERIDEWLQAMVEARLAS